jgi:hypothetical protein
MEVFGLWIDMIWFRYFRIEWQWSLLNYSFFKKMIDLDLKWLKAGPSLGYGVIDMGGGTA